MAERARRLLIAYAILLDAFAPSIYEPKMEYSYDPEWRCWIIAYGIVGLMMFVGWLLSF
jgi:hypothetical protein